MENRAIIYIRNLNNLQGDKNEFELQLDACNSFAAQNNYIVINPVFTDNISTEVQMNKRPGIKSLFEYCLNRTNNITHLIIYSWDILSQDINERQSADLLLGGFGITIRSVIQDASKNPSSPLINITKNILLLEIQSWAEIWQKITQFLHRS